MKGKVLPERQPFPNFEYYADIKSTDVGLDFKLKIEVIKSQIDFQVLSQNEITDIPLLKNVVHDFFLLVVNIEGYIHGCFYDVDIYEGYDVNQNKKGTFFTTLQDLEDDSSNRSIKDFREIINVFSDTKYNYLRFALNDLGLVIKHPKDNTFYCYRAIESLRKFFDENNAEKGWELFTNNLNISKATKDSIKKFANEPRHGGFKSSSSTETAYVTKTTWKIMDRFIIFIKNSNKPLDKITFPEL